MKLNSWILSSIAFLLMLSLTAGSPYEATGRVSRVVDEDTFDVQLQSHDSRITEDLIRTRLADIDCPEIHGLKACDAGKKAASYTRAWLLQGSTKRSCKRILIFQNR
jgi:endonuclease YncB( thermonuclease family)